MTVLERFYQGDQAALSRIISFIENRERGYKELLAQLYPHSGNAIRIGFTGPPGAGKSSLVNNIAGKLAADGYKTAVIAVDPTSPFTGGALLGDRVRIIDIPMDGSVFVRSMATRGSTGGLAAATDNVAVALDAFGFNFILLETVGVGQVELDIINTCDGVIVVLVPESGDAIQALKAGLMEIADIFAINKADRPGVDNFISQLNMILDIKRHQIEWEIPVIDTVAIRNINTDLLLEKIHAYIDYKKEKKIFEKHRRKQIKRKIYDILQIQIGGQIRRQLGRITDLDKIVTDIYNRATDPYTVADELMDLGDFENTFS
jgi:LAO/AO transport system kinase